MSEERLDIVLDLDSRDYEISIKRAEELLSKFGLGTRTVEGELQSLENRAEKTGRELKQAMQGAADSAREAEQASKRANQQVREQVSELKNLRIEAREQKRIAREQKEDAKQQVEASKQLVTQRKAELSSIKKKKSVEYRAAETNLNAAKAELKQSRKLYATKQQDSRDTRSLWEEEIAVKERSLLSARKSAATYAESAAEQKKQFAALQHDLKQKAAQTAKEIAANQKRIDKAAREEAKSTSARKKAEAKAWLDAEKHQMNLRKAHLKKLQKEQEALANDKIAQEKRVAAEIRKREALEERMYNKMRRRSSDLGRRFHHTFANIALGGFIFTQVGQGIAAMHNQLMGASGELERLHTLMRGMSSAPTSAGRDEAAAGDVKWLMENIQTMPFTLKEVAGSFVKLKSAGIDPTNGSLRALADSVASFGGDSHMLHRATVAVQQMGAKGVVSMEELRQQLGEAVPNAIQIMARATGMSMEELIDTVSKGQLESKTALSKMLVQMELELGGSSERMMNTWIGLTQRLQTSWMIFLDKIATSEVSGTSYFTEMKKAVSDIIAFMNSGTGQWLAETLGEGLSKTIILLKEAAAWAQKYWREIVAVGKAAVYGLLMKKFIDMTGGLISIISKAGGSLRALSKGFGMMGAGLTGATKSVGAFRMTLTGLSVVLGGLSVPLALATAGLAMMPGLFKTAADEAREVANEIDRTNGHLKISSERMENLKKVTEQLKNGEDVDGKHAANEEFLEDAEDRFLTRVGLVDKFGIGTVEKALKQFDQAKETYRRRKEEIESEYQSLQLDFERQQQVALIAEQNRIKDQYIRHAKIINNEKLAQIQNDYTAIIEAVTKGSTVAITAAQKNTLDEYTHTRSVEVYNEQIEDIKTEIAQKTKDLKKAADKEKADIQETLTGLQFALTHNQRARQLLVENRARQKKILDQENKILNGNEKSPADKAIGKVETQIKMTEQRIAAIKAQIESDGTSKGYAAKMSTLMDQIAQDAKEAGGHTEGLTVAIEKAKAAAEKLDALQLEEQSQSLLKRIGEHNKGMAEKFAGTTSKIGKLRAEIEQLKEAGKDTSQHEVELDVAIRYEKEKHHLTQLNKLNKKTIGDMKLKNEEYGKSAQQMAQLRFDRETQLMWDAVNSEKVSAEDRKKYLEQFYDWRDQREIQLAQESKSPTQKMLDQWSNMHEEMENATARWLDSTADAFAEAAISGKLSFSDLTNSIMKDIARMATNKLFASLVGSLFGGGGSLGGLFGGSGGGSTGDYSGLSSALGSLSMEPFANGGIMTKHGSATLKEYANGGIANSPQIALFGEGSMPEAYVPLPDGRTIPVTVQGGQTTAPQATRSNVSINLINQSGQQIQAEEGNQRFDGEKMILDVVLKAVTRPGSFRTTMKGAMNQ